MCTDIRMRLIQVRSLVFQHIYEKKTINPCVICGREGESRIESMENSLRNE